jgi:hypothetical protein
MVKVKLERYRTDLEKERYSNKQFTEGDFNKYQKMAFTRWGKKYGYRTWQGYVTARKNVEWKDYSWLRKHSP